MMGAATGAEGLAIGAKQAADGDPTLKRVIHTAMRAAYELGLDAADVAVRVSDGGRCAVAAIRLPGGRRWIAAGSGDVPPELPLPREREDAVLWEPMIRRIQGELNAIKRGISRPGPDRGGSGVHHPARGRTDLLRLPVGRAAQSDRQRPAADGPAAAPACRRAAAGAGVHGRWAGGVHPPPARPGFPQRSGTAGNEAGGGRHARPRPCAGRACPPERRALYVAAAAGVGQLCRVPYGAGRRSMRALAPPALWDAGRQPQGAPWRV